MSKEISIEIKATNLGPHRTLKSNDQVSSLELGIFANNGAGKTFISRAFRLIGNKSLRIEETNKLLTLGQNEGQFKIKISNSKESGVSREVEITLGKNKLPQISNTTNYTFHVFNCDYIKENLDELKFRPNGKIEGYILGKEKIDLSNERKEHERLTSELKKKIILVEDSVNSAKELLEALGIRKNTSEFIALSYENISNTSSKIQESDTFEGLKEKHFKLRSIPDNLSDVINVDFQRIPDFFASLKNYLGEGFNKSSVAEDFKKKIRSKQSFIETGLHLINSNKANCPFCEQSLAHPALQLIDEYVKYLNDNEAQQTKRATEYIIFLNNLFEDLKSKYNSFFIVKDQFYELKKFLPSLEKHNLQSLKDPRSIKGAIEKIVEFLNLKKENVNSIISNVQSESILSNIENWILTNNNDIRSNGAAIDNLNSRKRNLQGERLELNKRLCRAKFLEIQYSLKDTLSHIKQLNSEILELEFNIKTKEQSEKVTKKEKVIESFRFFLTQFFSNKYTFDDKDFCLRFLNHSLTENASDVLSEGEKSIVAFCYFLAETHRVIENEEDYQKLFFVIDDPISSLDFHFVYSVAQAIRSLNKTFKLVRIRYLILTHNLEFMSILIRNNIVSNRYFLINGGIQPLKRNLIMPYEEHLRDIYNISTSKSDPSHTTPNSIRHVLETINRFVSPDIEFSKFCEQVDGFQDSAFLYSLIHDSSHGGIRIQNSYTTEMVKSGCTLIIKYVGKHFSGQVELLNQG